MQTYTQLIKSSSTVRKQLWYLCGPEPALVQDALELAKDHVYSGVDSVSTEVLFGSSCTLTQFEEALFQPFFEDRRMIIVYDCDDIPFWSGLARLCQSLDPSVFVIFVGDQIPDDDDSRLSLFVNNKIGRSIRCVALSDEALKVLIQDRINVTTQALHSLVDMCSGDYEWLLNTLRILEGVGADSINPEIVRAVCLDSGIPPFEDSLVRFDKKQCLRYIRDRGTTGINVSKVERDVINLTILHMAIGDYNRKLRPLADKTGLTRKQLDEYMDAAPSYNSDTATRGLGNLMVLRDRLVRGDRSAYLSLVSGW